MKIILKQLNLLNFKGVREISATFDERETSVYGQNGTYKTTLADAFRWVLFGKNSHDESNFNVKTLNPDNTPVHYLDHEVEILLLVDGRPVSLKKSYKENWVTPRGQETPVMKGHETVYYYNNTLVTQREYQQKIDEICQEQTFKLLTDPTYFPGLHWEKQREIVSGLIETVTDDMVAKGNASFMYLLNSIAEKNVTLVQFKKSLATEKDKIKKNPDTGLDFIPSRISEAQRSIPPVLDWEGIDRQIQEHEQEIRKIEVSILDATKGLDAENEKRLKYQRAINEQKTLKLQIENKADSHIENLKYEFERKIRANAALKADIQDAINTYKKRITEHTEEIKQLKEKREAKLAEWYKINDEKFSYSDDKICPLTGLACNALPSNFLESERTKAEGLFNSHKQERLEANVAEGKKIAARIQEANAKIEALEKSIKEAEERLKEIPNEYDEPAYQLNRSQFLTDNKYDEIDARISMLEKELKELGEATIPDTTEQQQEKARLQAIIDGLKAQLATKDQIIKGNARIKELTDLQTKQSQQLANLEKMEFTIEKFENTKIDMIESRVNALFKTVKFKMFNKLINGSMEPTCVVMINGVPYPDLNTAGRIHAGLDIISVIAEHYNVFAPIWIDNRESILTAPEMENQIINLIASPTDKTLRIEPGKPFIKSKQREKTNV